jgi:tetratricopeptide (TPR) repeat protein
MVRQSRGWAVWQLMVLVVTVLAMTVPVAAQSGGGTVIGIVVNEDGQGVEGATVVVEATERSRRMELTTNSNGEFRQIGLQNGPHRVSAEKDGITAPAQTVNVRQGTPARIQLVLGMMSAAEAAATAAKNEELQALFDEGVAANNAKQYDVAIQKFEAGIAVNANCADCYSNIGYAHAQREEWEDAETAYLRATELAPNNAAGFNGLATVYNAMRRFDDAAAASAKAAELSGAGGGAGNAQALFTQGVIQWNGGNIPEAKKSFEAAIAADPNHAEAHFQLGMALVNEGDLPGAASEFKTYLQLAPDGENAATAQAMVAQLNP